MALRKKGTQIICDHYCINNRRSNFVYMALWDTTAFALSRVYLDEVFARNSDHSKVLQA